MVKNNKYIKIPFILKSVVFLSYIIYFFTILLSILFIINYDTIKSFFVIIWGLVENNISEDFILNGLLYNSILIILIGIVLIFFLRNFLKNGKIGFYILLLNVIILFLDFNFYFFYFSFSLKYIFLFFGNLLFIYIFKKFYDYYKLIKKGIDNLEDKYLTNKKQGIYIYLSGPIIFILSLITILILNNIYSIKIDKIPDSFLNYSLNIGDLKDNENLINYIFTKSTDENGYIITDNSLDNKILNDIGNRIKIFGDKITKKGDKSSDLNYKIRRDYISLAEDKYGIESIELKKINELFDFYNEKLIAEVNNDKKIYDENILKIDSFFKEYPNFFADINIAKNLIELEKIDESNNIKLINGKKDLDLLYSKENFFSLEYKQIISLESLYKKNKFLNLKNYFFQAKSGIFVREEYIYTDLLEKNRALLFYSLYNLKKGNEEKSIDIIINNISLYNQIMLGQNDIISYLVSITLLRENLNFIKNILSDYKISNSSKSKIKEVLEKIDEKIYKKSFLERIKYDYNNTYYKILPKFNIPLIYNFEELNNINKFIIYTYGLNEKEYKEVNEKFIKNNGIDIKTFKSNIKDIGGFSPKFNLYKSFLITDYSSQFNKIKDLINLQNEILKN